MNQTYSTQHNPLVQGIKVIGIGKHGSKPLPIDQIDAILDYLATPEVVPIQKGAFYGSLVAKGPTEEEEKLLYLDRKGSTERGALAVAAYVYDFLCADAPASMRDIGVKLLNKEFLSPEEAKQLGGFLFSDQPGDTLRGMAASMLRMRYETDEEYQGLMEAVTATYAPGFREDLPCQKNLIQLAEPFDGVEHSYLITPLLAEAFQRAGYTSLVTMGRSAGPKLTLNTLDIYKQLPETFIQAGKDLAQPSPAYGWALNQELLSPALDQWVEKRRLIFKRPFLATLEKVLNPCKARILITSVFHITYIEKMITLADMAGFTGVIVLKRGLEGTLAPSIAKASGVTCAAKQLNGTFKIQTFEANQEAFAAYRAEADELVEDLRVEDNMQLIKQFSSQGFTANKDFDKRVKLSLDLYQAGLEWLQSSIAV